MRLAYYAPLQSAASGIADYAQALFEGLAPHYEIKVNPPDSEAALRLYHIGNNPLHWEHYRLAIEKPGHVILHDAVLHHLLLGQLDAGAYVEEFVYNYGEWYREAARRYWERRAQSASDAQYFARPLLRRLAEASRTVIVHNQGALDMVRKHAPEAAVHIVPHLFVPPRDHSYYEIDTYRERILQVPRSEMLIGVLGHLRETKRIENVLLAYQDLRREGLPLRLLIQGEFVGPDLERRLESLLQQEGILRLGHLPGEEWWIMARALDVVANLRWPSAGESSGIATRLMGIAKPVLVTRGPETEDISAAAAIKVDPGLAEREELTSYLAWLCCNEQARLAVGRHAAKHIHQFHSRDAVVAQLRQILR